MSTLISRDLRNTLQVLRECAEDEPLESVKKTALLALDKLNLIFNELVSVNELLKGQSSTSLTEDSYSARIPFNETLRLVGKKDYYSKVNFVLFKCKELHSMLQKYDTPTAGLLEKRANFQREMSNATKYFQPTARKLCMDGVIEDISTMLVRIGDLSSFHHVDAVKAIAHYITKRRHNRVLSEDVKQPATMLNNKQPLKKRDLRLGGDFKNSENICLRKSRKNSRLGEFDIPGRALGDVDVEGNIPRDILSSLYRVHSEVVGDVTRLVTEKPKKSTSRINFIRGLLDDKELTKSAVDWTEELFGDEEEADNMSRNSFDDYNICPKTDTFATRLMSSHFPKMRNRKFFGDTQRVDLQAPPPVRKFKTTKSVERLRSNTSVFYAREKRLNLDPSEKARSGVVQEEEEKGMDLREELFREDEPEHKDRDEDIKRYIDRIRAVRMEAMERLANTNCAMPPRDRTHPLERLIGIRIPVQDSNVIKERMLYKGKNDTRKTIKNNKNK